MKINAQKRLLPENKLAAALACLLLMAGVALPVQAKTLVAEFLSTPADSSQYKESVSGCSTVSVNVAQQNTNTIVNLYSDGTFDLGYDVGADGDLLDVGTDIIVVSGIWSNIDTALTKFRFQPSGKLEANNSSTGGWSVLSTWMSGVACSLNTDNAYQFTYTPSFRITKADMTLDAKSNAGSLRLTVEGYGETDVSVATPPKTKPKIKLDLQAKGVWQ